LRDVIAINNILLGLFILACFSTFTRGNPKPAMRKRAVQLLVKYTHYSQ
jgi:hypothetical protein